MKIPENLDINEYIYNLPDERIAKFPLEKRHDSKLLFYNGSEITSFYFRDLPEILDTGHELIFNDTRVIYARIIFEKQTGTSIEVLLLEPYDPSGYVLSLSSEVQCSWICLVGNARRWKEGCLTKEFDHEGRTVTVKLIKLMKTGNTFLLLFTWDDQSMNFSQVISSIGLIPIPPYLKREAVPEDLSRYQTVYSRFEGSVAAPTAGLHFTDEVLKRLSHRGISSINITLHVGAGTFIPVKTRDAMEHQMHTEQIFVSRQSIEKLYNIEKKLIAVGTTSVRSLESLYWSGLKIKNGFADNQVFHLDQWEFIEYKEFLSRKESMRNILDHMEKNELEYIHIASRIMIVPGYEFMMTDGIITNFHQPGSTLLLLIAAYTGEDWKNIYNYALDNEYRFLSYGDSSLLMK